MLTAGPSRRILGHTSEHSGHGLYRILGTSWVDHATSISTPLDGVCVKGAPTQSGIVRGEEGRTDPGPEASQPATALSRCA